MDQPPLLLRADANSRMGTGHVMRCLALAQAWQERGGQPIFATAPTAPGLDDRLRAEGMQVVHVAAEPGSADDMARTARLAREVGAEWVVLDGYHFAGEAQWSLKEAGACVLAVDDYGHAGHYPADVVLNPNAPDAEGLYEKRGPHTRLLLGTDYVPLRSEFRRHDGRREVAPLARYVLVTLGGADPGNVTARVLQAVAEVAVPGLEVVAVVGANNPHGDAVRAAAGRCRAPVRIAHNVADMPSLLAWADVAVVGAGTTCWEAMFLGVPALVLVLADNQRPVARRVTQAQAARVLGSAEDLARELGRLLEDAPARALLRANGRRLIDGRGCMRVLRALGERGVYLRPVRAEDCRLLWEWSNDPDTRAASFTTAAIPWDEHVRWVERKRSDPGCLFFVAEDAIGTPLGQVRCEREDDEAVLSISLAPSQRGRGHGRRVLRLAAVEVFAASDAARISAYVKEDNAASRRAFLAAGFDLLGVAECRGHRAEHFVLRRAA